MGTCCNKDEWIQMVGCLVKHKDEQFFFFFSFSGKRLDEILAAKKEEKTSLVWLIV